MLWYEMSSFESKLKPKFKQLCVFGKAAQVRCLEACSLWPDFTRYPLPQFHSFVPGCPILVPEPIRLPVFLANYFWTPLTASVTFVESRNHLDCKRPLRSSSPTFLQKDRRLKGHCFSLNLVRVGAGERGPVETLTV